MKYSITKSKGMLFIDYGFFKIVKFNNFDEPIDISFSDLGVTMIQSNQKRKEDSIFDENYAENLIMEVCKNA